MDAFILGLYGWLMTKVGWGKEFTTDWIKPAGSIFINLLKLVAVPLVVISLSKGLADVRSLAKLSKIGSRTVVLFLLTTVASVILGLSLIQFFKPGERVNPDSIESLSTEYSGLASEKIELRNPDASGPLDFFVDLVPVNFFEALQGNGNMLQIIFFTLLFSISFLLIPPERQKPIAEIIDAANDVMIKMVHLIIRFAPIAVFALMASLVVETANPQLFQALLGYALILVGGMILILIIYVLLIGLLTDLPIKTYIKGVLPAQLVALTTSSSMATLPVTMECVEENLGVEKEVSSFVCPVGATLNMDATSLMQAIAAVFVSQVVGHELGWVEMLTIVLTASLASIGAAGAPSAGIVMLIMVLESIGFPSDQLPFALAMIIAIDRPLDMGRTVVNISGDSFVATLVSQSMKKQNQK